MSHFAKRHYEAFATAIQEAKLDIINKEPADCQCDMLAGVNLVRDHMADIFNRDNPRFDLGRFAHACEIGSNVKARTAHLKIA